MMKTRNEECPRCRDRGADTRRDNLVLYPDGGAHCFACGYHRFPKGIVRKVENASSSQTNALPRDFTREVPATGWKWLLQYGLPYSYWKPYTGYSPAEERVIFPIGNPVRFSTGRYVGSSSEGSVVVTRLGVAGKEGMGEGQSRLSGSSMGRPDSSRSIYLGDQGSSRSESGRTSSVSMRSKTGQVLPMRTPKWRVYGDRSGYAELLENKNSSVVVLVEDIVSAHKVAQVATCIPLFGTTIYTKVLQALKALKQPVALWLDEDQYGYLPKKINRLQAVLGLPVTFIKQRKDPKAYSVEEIRNILD